MMTNDNQILHELRIANIPTKVRLGALTFWVCGIIGLVGVAIVIRLYGAAVRFLFGGF